MEYNRVPSLANLRILDLTRIWAGPLGTRTLADFGAQVIKISDPRISISSDSRVNEKLNRNKLNLGLRLDTQLGREVFLDLLSISDIVIENYRPRVMRNFKLTYDDILKINPNIIMCSMPGFGLDGPYSEFPAFGSTAEAMSGIISMMGYAKDRPLQTGMSFADPISALNLVGTILTYARHRSLTGMGSFIEIDLADSPLANIGEYIVSNSVTNYQRPIQGNGHETYAPHGAFPTSGDDEWVAISITTDDMWVDFVNYINVKELIELKSKTYIERKSEEIKINSIISQWTKTKTSTEIMESLQNRKIAAGRVSNNKQLLDDQHLNDRDFFINFKTINQKHDGQAIPGNKLEKKYWFPMQKTGEGNPQVLNTLLGYSNDKIHELETHGIIGKIE